MSVLLRVISPVLKWTVYLTVCILLVKFTYDTILPTSLKHKISALTAKITKTNTSNTDQHPTSTAVYRQVNKQGEVSYSTQGTEAQRVSTESRYLSSMHINTPSKTDSTAETNQSLDPLERFQKESDQTAVQAQKIRDMQMERAIGDQ